jgi:lipid-A-disaccharide synthase
MKFYLVAGEPSGDMYGAKLMREIKKNHVEAKFRFWGGDKMEAEGGEQVSHIKKRTYMGIWEVAKNLIKIKKNFKLFEKDIAEYLPDAVIFIDYPGFNLRVAPIVNKLGIPVHFFIAPKVWAWNSKRIIQIKKHVDFLYTILPFEPEYFKNNGIVSDYVGNPLMDIISDFKPDLQAIEYLKNDKPVVALLPGSRKMELQNILPLMASAKKHFPDYRFVVAGSDSFSDYELQYIKNTFDLEVLRGKTYEILSVAKAALVTSGTATLETAIWDVPQVVCYKFSKISYVILKPLIKIKYISLVNLIMDKLLVKELIQNDLTETNIRLELDKILQAERQREIKLGYAALRIKVGKPGAIERTAKLILERTQKS